MFNIFARPFIFFFHSNTELYVKLLLKFVCVGWDVESGMPQAKCTYPVPISLSPAVSLLFTSSPLPSLSSSFTAARAYVTIDVSRYRFS